MKSVTRPVVLLAAALLLVSCGKADTTPTWEGTLPATGVAMSASGCEVIESSALWFQEEDGEGQTLCLLTAAGTPTLDWEGVTEDAVTVTFVEPTENGYLTYSESEPIEKVDYTPCRWDGMTLEYRFDTVYSFLITVTTPDGTDRFLLDTRRDR